MKFTDRVRRLQRWLKEEVNPAIEVDGKFGPQTLGGVEMGFGIGAHGTLPPVDGTGEVQKFDDRSEKNLATLLPEVQSVFRQLLAKGKQIAAEHGCTMKVISGNRTWKEQDELYAQGRTKPGPRVTNARGGYSNHNFGVAADMGIFRGREYVDAADSRLAERIYHELATTARALGLEWGGDWRSFQDTPHFQYDTGLTLAEMRSRLNEGRPIV